MKKTNINTWLILTAITLTIGCKSKDSSEPIPSDHTNNQIKTHELTANSNYKVYLHTGMGPDDANKLWNLSTFSYVNSQVTGLWAFGPTFTQTTAQNNSIIQNINADNKFSVIECSPYKNNKTTTPTWFENGTQPPQLMSLYNRGFENPQFIMLYREGPEGLWIDSGDTTRLKRLIEKTPIPPGKPKYYWTSKPWMTLMRSWGAAQRASIDLPDVRAMVFEIAPCVGFNQAFSNAVPDAIKHALNQDKWAFILLPPMAKSVSKGTPDPNANNNYLKAVQDAFAKLKVALGNRINDDRLVFVPANYDYSLKGVPVTPESYFDNGGEYNENSSTGAARWLLKVRSN